MGRRISPSFAMGTLATCPLLKVELHRMLIRVSGAAKCSGRSMCIKHTPLLRCATLVPLGAMGPLWGEEPGRPCVGHTCTPTPTLLCLCPHNSSRREPSWSWAGWVVAARRRIGSADVAAVVRAPSAAPRHVACGACGLGSRLCIAGWVLTSPGPNHETPLQLLELRK